MMTKKLVYGGNRLDRSNCKVNLAMALVVVKILVRGGLMINGSILMVVR